MHQPVDRTTICSLFNIMPHNQEPTPIHEIVVQGQTDRRSNQRKFARWPSRRQPQNESQQPETQRDVFERGVVKRIKYALQRRDEESPALQDFYRNGLFRPPLIPSEDYRAEYNHFFGLEAYGIRKSALVGSAAFGILIGLQVGDLPRQLIVSTAVAVLTSYKHAFDPQEDSKRFVKDPLLPGRCTIAENYCPVVVTEYRKSVPLGYEPKDPTLQMYCEFADNCELRSAFEDGLRRFQGLSSDSLVSNPPPGISINHPFCTSA